MYQDNFLRELIIDNFAGGGGALCAKYREEVQRSKANRAARECRVPACGKGAYIGKLRGYGAYTKEHGYNDRPQQDV